MKNQRNQARHLLGLILALIGLMSGITLPRSFTLIAKAEDRPFDKFIRVGDLNQERAEARYEVLHDGRVLAIGGRTTLGATATCELLRFTI